MSTYTDKSMGQLIQEGIDLVDDKSVSNIEIEGKLSNDYRKVLDIASEQRELLDRNHVNTIAYWIRHLRSGLDGTVEIRSPEVVIDPLAQPYTKVPAFLIAAKDKGLTNCKIEVDTKSGRIYLYYNNEVKK